MNVDQNHIILQYVYLALIRSASCKCKVNMLTRKGKKEKTVDQIFNLKQHPLKISPSFQYFVSSYLNYEQKSI